MAVSAPRSSAFAVRGTGRLVRAESIAISNQAWLAPERAAAGVGHSGGRSSRLESANRSRANGPGSTRSKGIIDDQRFSSAHMPTKSSASS